MKKLANSELGAVAPTSLFNAAVSLSNSSRLPPNYAIPAAVPLLAFSYGQAKGSFEAHCIGAIALLR